MKYILPLILIVSCSTTKENVLRDRKESSLDNSFKKETAYSNSSIQDYYDNQLKTLNPASGRDYRSLQSFGVIEYKVCLGSFIRDFSKVS